MGYRAGGGKVGVPQNIMHAHYAVKRPDHFKFASYGPAVAFKSLSGKTTSETNFTVSPEFDIHLMVVQVSLETASWLVED